MKNTYSGKIMITKCSGNDFWYKNWTGCIFLADFPPLNNKYTVYRDGKPNGLVLVDDCVDVSEPETPELNKWMVEQDHHNKLICFLDYLQNEKGITIQKSLIDSYLNIDRDRVKEEEIKLREYIKGLPKRNE